MSATPADFDSFYASEEFQRFIALSDEERGIIARSPLVACVGALGPQSTAELLGRCIIAAQRPSALNEYVRKEEKNGR